MPKSQFLNPKQVLSAGKIEFRGAPKTGGYFAK